MCMELVNFHDFRHLWLHFEHCVKLVFKKFEFLVFPSKTYVFIDTGLTIGAVCGRCCVAIPAIASARQLMEMFASDF